MKPVDPVVQWLRILSLGTLLLAILVVLLGAWTRLSGAGLGCPDWPGCYGEWRVPGPALWASPAYAGLEAGKAWLEMIHRYAAAALGGLIIILGFLAWRWRRLPGCPWRLVVGLLVLLVLQGAFGAFTVTLKLWPQVVTLHLLGGLGIVALTFGLYRRSSRRAGMPVSPERVPWLFWLAAMLLTVQLALGGWTSSNYAGIACLGVPTCNGQWWPAMAWGEGFHVARAIGPSYLDGLLHAEARTAIHVTHRLGAVLLGATLALLAWRYRSQRHLRRWLTVSLGAYVLQAALGVANVVFWLPPMLALAHTGGAILLVLGLVGALEQVAASSGRSPARLAIPGGGGVAKMTTPP